MKLLLACTETQHAAVIPGLLTVEQLLQIPPLRTSKPDSTSEFQRLTRKNQHPRLTKAINGVRNHLTRFWHGSKRTRDGLPSRPFWLDAELQQMTGMQLFLNYCAMNSLKFTPTAVAGGPNHERGTSAMKTLAYFSRRMPLLPLLAQEKSDRHRLDIKHIWG